MCRKGYRHSAETKARIALGVRLGDKHWQHERAKKAAALFSKFLGKHALKHGIEPPPSQTTVRYDGDYGSALSPELVAVQDKMLARFGRHTGAKEKDVRPVLAITTQVPLDWDKDSAA